MDNKGSNKERVTTECASIVEEFRYEVENRFLQRRSEQINKNILSAEELKEKLSAAEKEYSTLGFFQMARKKTLKQEIESLILEMENLLSDEFLKQQIHQIEEKSKQLCICSFCP